MNHLVAPLIASLALLAGCGAEPPSGSTADIAGTAAAKPQLPPAVAPAADEALSKMARAVGDGKPGAAVELRYDFLAKPAVGSATPLEIVFVPSVGVDALEASLRGMPGISVTGPATASFANVQAGKSYKHSVSVQPERTGVFYVSVTVSTAIGSSSLARTFSIPFVVGNAPAAQKAAPERDASGEAIQRMQATEPKP